MFVWIGGIIFPDYYIEFATISSVNLGIMTPVYFYVFFIIWREEWFSIVLYGLITGFKVFKTLINMPDRYYRYSGPIRW
jgi:hypothetical protein